MRIVESISDACTELRARIGPGLNIRLARVWPPYLFFFDKEEYIVCSDITWMWDKPSQTHRERVREGLAAADEKIRVLIADGVDPGGEHSLLEELRQAGSFLPQRKDDLVKMDVYEPRMGISESDWQWIKKVRGGYDEFPRDEILDPRLQFRPFGTTSLSWTTANFSAV